MKTNTKSRLLSVSVKQVSSPQNWDSSDSCFLHDQKILDETFSNIWLKLRKVSNFFANDVELFQILEKNKHNL